MTWLLLAAAIAVACWLLYRSWVSESRDYNEIEHRRHGMEVLWKMHNERSDSDHEGSDQP